MNKSKKIAFLLPDLEWGGLERVAVNLIKEFCRSDVNIDLVVASAKGVFLQEIPPQVKIINLQIPVEPRLKSTLRILFPLTNYLQKEKPAVLISHLFTCNVITIMAKMLAISSTKLMLVEHISLYQKQEKGSKNIQDQLLPILMRWFYPSADKVVAVSQGLARELEDYLQLKSGTIDVIYNPVIDDQLVTKAQLSVKHPWFNDKTIPIILGVGRLVPQKDFATLIKAFAIVRKKQKARLVILGEGGLKDELLALVEGLNLTDDVAILDFVENPYAYMAKSAVFVLSSIAEGLPTVLIEAMAVGIPVISTNCPSGPVEILDNGKYGELVPVGDSKALGNAILKVLNGKNNPVNSSWLEQFTLKNSAQKYIDLISK